MPQDALSELLASRDWLMADGATGTNLFNMGLGSGEPPEFWNVDKPENILKLYRGAVDAGSDIFLTNSFGGNASRLKLHAAQGRVGELNRVAAELGREVADKAGRKVVVAGSMGPTGDIFEPMGTLTHELAVEMFHEQADALKAGGADVLWVETISAPEEYRAAAEAARLAGMAWCGTMSFDTAGRTMMGVTSAALAEMVEKLPNPPVAFGANCGVGRLGPDAHHPGLRRRGHQPADHRQGQCRDPEIPRGPHPLRRHARADGGICRPRPRCRARGSSAAAAARCRCTWKRCMRRW